MLTKITEDFLNEIYKHGTKINYIDETDLFIVLEKARRLSKRITYGDEKKVTISKLLKGNYGVDEIKKYIKNNADNGRNKVFSYNFNIENDTGLKREVNLIFVDYSGLKRSVYNRYAERVFIILYLLRNTSDYCSKELKIFCYMTPFKKLLPESRSVVLSSKHINTGVTYQCIKNNEVCIYRKEEWFKVLIHELLHAHGVDMRITFSPNQFYINSKVHVGEAYVEFWAVYLNSAIAAYYLAKEDSVLENTKRLFSEYLAKFIRAERIFSLIQVNKILRHNNVKYTDLFVSRNKYREKTNAFAYFILKSILLFNYYNFMVKSMKYNNNNYTVINQTYIEKFIEKYSKNRDYQKYLKKLNINYMNNSLRLTIIEIV